jgi:predicted ATPase
VHDDIVVDDDTATTLCELDAAEAAAEQPWEDLAAAAERLRVVHNEHRQSRSEEDEEVDRVREENAKLRALLKRMLAAAPMPAPAPGAEAGNKDQGGQSAKYSYKGGQS